MKENNGVTGIVLTVIISFVLIAVNPSWYGFVLFKDSELGIGLFVGMLFALKYHKPEQSPLKYGVKIGFIAGILSTIAPSILIWLLFGGHFLYALVTLGFMSITGIALGLIVGGFLGWYYMGKERKIEMDKEREEKYGDDFFEDLIDK
ncbi:MAG: hypothetical protein ACFE9Z_13735 [Promethearchaeota archaeon]